MLVGAAVRLAVGAGYLLTPSNMASVRLAPETADRPDARLFVRGFGGHQAVIGALTLAVARARRLAGPVLALNLLIDALDMTSTALEMRARSRPDRTLIGSLALSGTAIAWGLALGTLDR